jgi:hypothetical protein
MGRREGWRKLLLDDLKKKRYCKLKRKALHCTLWRTGFRKGYGPVVRETTVNFQRTQRDISRRNHSINILSRLAQESRNFIFYNVLRLGGFSQYTSFSVLLQALYCTP